MTTEIPQSPGSVNNFAKKYNKAPKEVFIEYTKELGEYRERLLGKSATKSVLTELEAEKEEE